jgi:hypothetical protein
MTATGPMTPMRPARRLPMTPARRAILAFGVPVALAIIGSAAFSAVALADQVSYRVRLSAPVTGGQARVHIRYADATIHAGTGNRIQVAGTLRGSLARPSFSWRSTAAGLTLHNRCPSPVGSCSGGYAITVPAGLPVAASSSSGELQASGLRAGLTLSDSFGDIEASGITGTISLTDSSGDISASGLTGGVRLRNSFGDITVTGLASTNVVGIDSSGDITLTFTTVPRRVDVTDSFGDITLILPPGPARYQVSTHNSDGDTVVSVHQQRSSPYVITASDSSGDITIGYG